MKLTNFRIVTPRPICRSLSCGLVTAWILFGFLFSTRAFFPTDFHTVIALTPSSMSHQRITEEAITEFDRESFGINRLTTTMEKAKEKIWLANAKVDEDQKTAAKHFDGESFIQGNRRIIELKFSCVEALQKNNAEGARILLGSALHTIQDFYSHSNWVELGNTAPHPHLGFFGDVFTNINRVLPTCRDCTGGASWNVPIAIVIS